MTEWNLLVGPYSFSNNHLSEENIELLMGALQGTCRLKKLQSVRGGAEEGEGAEEEGGGAEEEGRGG